MKETKDKKLIDLLEQLAALSEKRKEYEREEKTLKAIFKAELKERDTSALQAGAFVFAVREVIKRPLDESLLLRKLGSLEEYRTERRELHTSVTPAEAPASQKKAGGAS